MNLHELRAEPGARKSSKRLGQGVGSGTGKTSGKGNKGHKSRTGGGVRPGFEGGQMPLARRVPKSGFNNARFAKEYRIVNIGTVSEKFPAGGEVSVERLVEAGVIHSGCLPVKLLGKGDVGAPFFFKVNAASEGAKKKVEAAGGKVEVI
ncbi:MAG: 50S ribosomal protein L15 [Synergistaceae bacterium]|jgi:large subunit ribosomal protein L15|nr:50S ribosomal protein L15 [Synergistaceae bacterium]